MYTRTYFTEDKKSSVPENYDGNAFYCQPKETDKSEQTSAMFSPPNQEQNEDLEAMGKVGGGLSSIMEKLPLKNLSSLLPFQKKGENGRFNFGTEEILICAAALYMFFSKSGDKECAIMLIILLFID